MFPRPRRRRLAAWLCLVALVAGAIVLPAMHAAEHAAEHRQDANGPRREASGRREHVRPQRVAHRTPHRAPSDVDRAAQGDLPRERRRDDAVEQQAPHPHHHHHDGDRPGEHGDHSPAHLASLIAPASAPAIPPRVTPATILEPTFQPRPVTIAVHRRPAIRAPPAAVA